jgi:hypothetical protein
LTARKTVDMGVWMFSQNVGIPSWIGRALVAALIALVLIGGTVLSIPRANGSPLIAAVPGGPASFNSTRQLTQSSVLRVGPRLTEFPDASWNWIFVGLFGFFGISQLAVLIYLSSVTGKAANAAKKAVELTEQTTTDFESPFVFPVLVSNTILEHVRLLEEPVEDPNAVAPCISFTIRNFGRTPALLQRVSAVLFCGEIDDAQNDVVTERVAELMLEPQGSLIKPLAREMRQPLAPELLEPIKTGVTRIFLRGRILFMDVQGHRFDQMFCFVWDPETSAFMPWGPHRNRRRRLNSKRKRLA